MRQFALFVLFLIALLSGGPVYAINGTLVLVASDVQNTSSTVWADVTGLTHSVSASTIYHFECYGSYTTAVSTTAIHFSVNGPASPTNLNYSVELFITSTNDSGATGAAYDTVPTNPATSSGTTAMPWRMAGTLENGSNSGTLAIRVKSEVNTSAVNVLRGAACVFF